jgi:DNA-binding CsgD family transcriptional regulator
MSDAELGLYQNFRNVLARIAVASQHRNIWPYVREFIGILGYSHMAGAEAARLAGGAANAIFYTDAPSVPADIDRVYTYATAPFVSRALRSPEPFLISELRADPRHSGRSWIDLMAPAVRWGDGLVVPVYDGHEPLAGFIFGGRSPDTSALTQAMLQVLAHAAFNRYRTLQTSPVPSTRSSLTGRELQCLRLVAGGKSDSEAAKALGISARTVRFHMDSVKTKLSVDSRVRAVARALRDRIITI